MTARDPAVDRLAAAAIEQAGDAQCEVVVDRTDHGLTRFADSSVHQSVASERWNVAVRVVLDDGRAGVASSGAPDHASAAATARQAIALASCAPPDPGFAGVAEPAQAGRGWYDGRTATASPADRAEAVAQVLDAAQGVPAAGSVSTALTERAVWTSAGQRVADSHTAAQLQLVLTGPGSSGWAESGGHALGELDPAGAAARALGKVRAGNDPQPVEAGTWPVVLEPCAVASLVQFMCYLGFGAKTVAEGRSFVSDRLGEAALSSLITLVDDASDSQARGMPFDFEGTPKQRVVMVDNGVLRGVVHDRRSAAAWATDSTGHALPAPNPHGPMPQDPFLVPGDGQRTADLVAGLERGLLVTRLHYVNVVHPKETLLTGMTRDGTFLVEEGQVVAGVRNLRFTQSAHEALAQVDAVSSDVGYATELVAGGTRQPALALPAFRFSGQTDFG